MNKNIKFFLKLIIALLPLFAIILYTVLVPYGYMDIEYSSWKYTKSVVKNASVYNDNSSSIDTSDVPEVLILGDSRAMADLIPTNMNISAANLAVGGATSIEMYYTLNNYIKNNGAPKKAIIMFAPFHYTIMDNFWTRTAYFNYLSPSDITDLCSYAKATGSETIIKKNYQNDIMSYMVRFPDKYLPALLNARFVSRYDVNKAEYESIATNLGYGEFGTADGCSDLNYETGYEHMHTTGDAVLLDIYMNRLLKLCVDNGIETVVAIPPMNKSSYSILHESYTSELSDYFNDLKIKYPAITIDGDIPCYEDIYFGDSSHLNRKGAEVFTEEFISTYY